MSDNENGDASAERARGISQLDAALLRRVAELASRGGTSEELQTLAKAIVGVIQTQAEMAEFMLLPEGARPDTGLLRLEEAFHLA